MQIFNDISHLVIRDHLYVSGTSEKPEVKVFVQTNSKRKPINEKYLQSNQNVWMKWNDGPIVAKSKLLSWHLGSFSDGNINNLRELCIGTNLFGLNNYWKTVSNKINGYYAVMLLSDENWLHKPIYPNARSYGSSWIYLDSKEKSSLWLTHDDKILHQENNQIGRNIPKGLRFDVLKRDNYTCKYCGAKAPNVQLHVDHVIPWKIVKKHEINNLVTACVSCNSGKSDKVI